MNDLIKFNNNQRLLSVVEVNKIKNSYAGDKFFMKKTRSMIRNKEYRKMFNGPGGLYEYLWANIIRAEMKNDIYSIYNKYYNKGFLASSCSFRKLSKECHMDKNTIKSHIDAWEKRGVIKKDKLGQKNRGQYIYILGTWQYLNGVKSERLYLEDEFE